MNTESDRTHITETEHNIDNMQYKTWNNNHNTETEHMTDTSPGWQKLHEQHSPKRLDSEENFKP